MHFANNGNGGISYRGTSVGGGIGIDFWGSGSSNTSYIGLDVE